MSTFVLVHGAWGGAHGFHLVRPLLQQAGHAVFTPSLTGIGERSHLTGPHITLTTHVRDVVNHVLYEDLNDVVLLGFSYGGMVVTGSLDHIGDRVRHLVYLDAFVPRDGQSLSDLTGRPNPGFGIAAPWSMPPASTRLRRRSRGDVVRPAQVRPARWHLHRAGPALALVGGVAVQSHLRQGPRRSTPCRPAERLLRRR